MWLPKDYEEIPQIPELTKLKHLTLDVKCGSRFRSRTPCVTSLVKAAPSLNKFTFKLFSCGYPKAVQSKTLILHPHECLKDVEIVGFGDRKFVTYLLQNAINLEKITINPYHPYDHSGKFLTSKEREKKEEARKRLHRLREKLPSGVKLIVL